MPLLSLNISVEKIGTVVMRKLPMMDIDSFVARHFKFEQYQI